MSINTSLSDIWAALAVIFKYKLFEINQTPVTISSILMFVVVFLIFILISRIVNKVILKGLLTKLEVEPSHRYTIIRIGHYVVMIIGAIVAFQFIGINLGGLAVIFGLLSVGIGFGLQNVTSNFIAGLILLFERPIKIGDRVTVGDTEGDVMAINMRSTAILTLNNITIIVPNSQFISERVTNWSHGDPKIRLEIEVGVSYNSDLDLVLKSLREVADADPDVMKNPEPSVALTSFGDSSWNMILRVWIKSPELHYQVRSQINCAIVRKFREVGIEIPYPQRDLHVRSPLPMPFSRGENG